MRGPGILSRQAQRANAARVGGLLSNYADWVLSGDSMRQGLQNIYQGIGGALRGDQQAFGGLLGDFLPGGGVGGGLLHTVWHGSPHKWVTPDISKVGTGEGAQAYGHGFYSAESPEVASTYREAANWVPGKGMGFKVGNEEIFTKNIDEKQILEAAVRGDNEFLDRVRKQADLMANKSSSDYLITENVKKRDLIDKIRKNGVLPIRDGYLYKLDIPDEDIPKYLDWDKPLSEQSQSVKEAINRALSEVKRNPEQFRGKTGQEVLQYLMPSGNKSEASERLRRFGIPGIRYLDGTSRGAGQGTYNYVTFDPSRIRVLERNGVPIGQLTGGLLGR